MNKIEENLVKWKEIEAKVIARALTDEAFRTRLEQDPRETIETELQCKVSGDVTFKVREEENPGEMTILLPKLPKKEMGEQLTDREIDDIVAAGNIGIAVGIVLSGLYRHFVTDQIMDGGNMENPDYILHQHDGENAD